jgi:hypothetical protein
MSSAMWIADYRSHVSFRTVETEDEVHAAIVDDLRALSDIGSDIRRILSLTLSVRGGDVTDVEIENCNEVLHLMQQLGVAEDIILTTERGEQEDHLHMQAMLHGPFRARKLQSKLMKSVFEKRQCFDRGFNCTVKIHKPNENVSWKSMTGCDYQIKFAC